MLYLLVINVSGMPVRFASSPQIQVSDLAGIPSKLCEVRDDGLGRFAANQGRVAQSRVGGAGDRENRDVSGDRYRAKDTRARAPSSFTR